ncbi:MAG: hypothetical protein IT208_17910 [Chthonomonadales bacterium]|nr:hypothetical protein [Chthonomonadales bacterium]
MGRHRRDAPTGKWVLTRPAVAPGRYELAATFASSGGTWKGTTAIDVEPDLAKEVTIAMTKQ